MGIIDILLTGVGLSMDAAAVSMTNGMNESKMKLPKILLIALFYGVAQGVMPLIGYYAGSLFATAVAKIAPWLALVLLGFIGGKMIFEAICELKKEKNGEQPKEAKPLSLGSLAVQALATSIDALAVGISLVALDKSGALAVNIFVAVSMIAASTFIISLVSVFIGKKFGELLSDKAELVGGLILVAIGLKIFIEGIFF